MEAAEFRSRLSSYVEKFDLQLPFLVKEAVAGIMHLVASAPSSNHYQECYTALQRGIIRN